MAPHVRIPTHLRLYSGAQSCIQLFANNRQTAPKLATSNWPVVRVKRKQVVNVAAQYSSVLNAVDGLRHRKDAGSNAHCVKPYLLSQGKSERCHLWLAWSMP
eukprot:6207305-Pleurochrysis_carterae.AAC.1